MLVFLRPKVLCKIYLREGAYTRHDLVREPRQTVSEQVGTAVSCSV
jgi:hypothetical protein